MAPLTVADFKVRLSNAYPTGEAAFTAMLSRSGQGPGQPQAAANGQPGPGLSLEAFTQGTATFRPPLSPEEAKFAFRGLDSNRDGQLMQGEFLEVLWSGQFLPSSGPPEELGQALTTITSSRGPTTTVPAGGEAVTTSLQVSEYHVTEAVVQDEGVPLGDFTDRDYSLAECKALCDKKAGCHSLAYFNGDCHLKDRCVHPSDPVNRQSTFRTYYKPCASKAFAYETLGPGYCPHGYYAGGDPLDAVDLATCQERCNEEPQCMFISLHLKDTCSRYTSKAGNCEDRPLGQQDHVSYRRQPLAQPAQVSLPAASRDVVRIGEGTSGVRSPPSVFGSSLSPEERGAPGHETPITMADFKARMLKVYASSVHAFQALGTNPSGFEDFARGATTFKPPLTTEQAKYAFRGLDTDHDEMLRSFEFFEVIECGHFFPTSEELAELQGSRRAFRVPLTRGSSQRQGGSSMPVAVLTCGLATCCLAALIVGWRSVGKAKTDTNRRTYSVMPSLAGEGTETSVASTSPRTSTTPSSPLVSAVPGKLISL